jgi:hypothetical protein
MKTRITTLGVALVAAAALAQGVAAADAIAKPDLARARAATARYHDPAVAAAEGFVGAECEPNMGIHTVKFDRLDFTLDVAQPENLLYEPTATGLRLVGMEYVVAAPADDPPTLFGQALAQGPEIFPGTHVWALHVWAWRHNPAGMFEPYNPSVNC